MTQRIIPQKSASSWRPAPSRLNRLNWTHWGGLFLGVLFCATALGAALGLVGGSQMKARLRATNLALTTQVQFDLALADLEAGRHHLAKQRLEYVIAHDPQFPGALEELTGAMILLASTERLLMQAAEVLPTPTRDPRPAQELFDQAQSALANGQWTVVIDTVVALRAADPQFQVVAADRMMYLALRFRGEQRILNEGNLEGGLYDLALAERFAPLDAQAHTVREWARLYVIGASYWGVMPDQSAFYFEQLALAAPGIRDASGLTAAQRYSLALVQFGDWLGRNGEWCAALGKFQAAAALGSDPAVEPTAAYAAVQCAGPAQTQTPTPVGIPPTPTSGFPVESPTVTPSGLPTETPLPAQTELPTQAPSVTASPTPTATDEPEG